MLVVRGRSRLLASGLTLPRFRALLAYPTWGYVCQAVHAARLYREGYEAGLELIAFLDDHATEFSPADVRQHLLSLAHLILDCLDRMDRWEEFLDWHERARVQTGYGLRVGRRRVIERKLARRGEGLTRIGDYHHSPDSLTDAERAQRLAQIFAWAEAGILRVMAERARGTKA